MNIVIKSIPNSEQRYPTVGDYWRDADGTLQIRVSKMSDDRYDLLVALHELIEVTLCEHRGIKEEDISKFDIEFEKEREEGKHTLDDEPGWDPRAPYGKEHAYAESIERNMALQLEVDWKDYDHEVMNL